MEPPRAVTLVLDGAIIMWATGIGELTRIP